MASSPTMETLAKIGAGVRLGEIAEERAAIFRVFPELRRAAAVPLSEMERSQQRPEVGGKAPRKAKRRMSPEARQRLRENLAKARAALAVKRAAKK